MQQIITNLLEGIRKEEDVQGVLDQYKEKKDSASTEEVSVMFEKATEEYDDETLYTVIKKVIDISGEEEYTGLLEAAGSSNSIYEKLSKIKNQAS